VINPEGGYTQPCIFWTSHSGQAKTPPQQVIVQPLEDMEAAAMELHDLQLADYEQDKIQLQTANPHPAVVEQCRPNQT